MIKQRSKEWFAQRLGKFTASSFGDLLGKGRAKGSIFTLAGETLIREKLTERLTGKTKQISSEALDWGIDMEPEAIKFYEDTTGNRITEAPFIKLKGYEDWAGGSPDGFIEGENGIIEVKCPFDSTNHTNTLLNNKIPNKYFNKYYTQIQFNMFCSETDCCDFISYDPRMIKDKHKIHIIRIKRDEEAISEILVRLNLSIKELEIALEILK